MLDDVWLHEGIKNGAAVKSIGDNLADDGKVWRRGREKTGSDEEDSGGDKSHRERQVRDKTVDADETRRKKAMELRYRKPIVKNINLDTIRQELWDIIEACDEVRYYFEDDDDSLINALDGDEDETHEFKMMFSDLSAECEQMQEDMACEYIPECFDSFFVAIGAGYKGGGYLGWDSYEQDYLGLSCTDSYVEGKCKEKLMRLTKERLIESARMCFRVYIAYLGIRHRYDCLKAAMDILKDQNTGCLQMAKKINETYEKANADNFYSFCQSTKDLEKLVSCMPDIAWVQ